MDEQLIRAIMDVLAGAFEENSSLFYKERFEAEAWYRDGDSRIGGSTDVRKVAEAVAAWVTARPAT